LACPDSAHSLHSHARDTGSLHATTRLLLRRSYLNLSRQPVMLASRMLQAISFGSVLCIFFTRLRDDGPRAVQNRVGLLYELLTLVYVGMLNCIAIFPAERDVFYAEAAEGAYGTAAFVLTYTALEVPCEIASALVFGALVGPIAGMRASPRHFFMLVYGLACVMNAGESIGIAFCALTSHAAVSVTLMSVLLSLLAVMAGFFSVGMPPLLQAINYASVLRYMARALGVNEFAGLQLEGGMSGDAALALYRLRPQEAARDTWLLGLLTVLYRLLAAAALHASKRRHV
jgi:ABC-type multidrug transport system permease subunit